jgi:hypothetical protein
MRRLRNIGFGQCRHAVEAGDCTGTNGIEQCRTRNICPHHGHAEPQPFTPGDVADHRQRRVQMGRGNSRSGRPDDQRDIQFPSGKQHAAEVAAGRFGGGRHLALAEVSGTNVDRSHVATDQVRSAVDASLERGRRNAVAELTGCAQQADWTWGATKFRDDPTGGAQISIPKQRRVLLRAVHVAIPRIAGHDAARHHDLDRPPDWVGDDGHRVRRHPRYRWPIAAAPSDGDCTTR